MSRVLLLHRPGADREVLASWLAARGHELELPEDLAGLRSLVLNAALARPPVAVLQAAAAPADGDFTFLNRCPSVSLGDRRMAPRGAHSEQLDDPCFLDDLQAVIDRLAHGPPAREAGSAIEGTPPPPSGTRSLLLRGIAHALSNPLSAARGWLQLLSSGNDPRHMDRIATELARMEQLAHALSLLGRGSSGLCTRLDLERLLEPRISRLSRDGLEIRLTCSTHEGLVVDADPSEWELMFDLMLSSLYEDRNRVKDARVMLEARDEGVEIIIQADGIQLPGNLDPARLGDLLLKRIRHTRALALSLAHLLVVETGLGSLEISNTDGECLRITLSLRSAARAGDRQ